MNIEESLKLAPLDELLQLLSNSTEQLLLSRINHKAPTIIKYNEETVEPILRSHK